MTDETKNLPEPWYWVREAYTVKPPRPRAHKAGTDIYIDGDTEADVIRSVKSLVETEKSNDDVPAGWRVQQLVFGGFGIWRPGEHPPERYDTRADAIAACREHARRVAEGSELVAELRAQLEADRQKWEQDKQAIEYVVKRCGDEAERATKAERERDALRTEVERLTDRERGER